MAIGDCRHLLRRLEADLLAVRERIVRVPPKVMAHIRAFRLEPSGRLIRSTCSRLRVQRYANAFCRLLLLTVRTVKSDSSLIIGIAW